MIQTTVEISQKNVWHKEVYKMVTNDVSCVRINGHFLKTGESRGDI